MAQSKDNFMTYGLSGTIGRLVTFSIRAGKVIVGKVRRKSTKPPTEDQLEVRDIFGNAVTYGKASIADLVKKALYAEKAEPGQSAFNVACADFCTPPKVVFINTENYHGGSDDQVLIRATDDFKVVQVKVAIHTAAGELVEEGNAVQQSNGPDWLYTPTQENEAAAGSKIKATAIDLPGNQTSLEVTV
jgi:hypothetical protein